MGRARFQVLIIPYRMAKNGQPEYAIGKRSDMDAWQFFSGGGEADEVPMEAARREANEEGGISTDLEFIQLDSIASRPAHNFAAHEDWEEDVYVIPEYSFCVDVGPGDLVPSGEHTEILWRSYEEAQALLSWDSNRTALWEVNQRITRRWSRL
jgi:dihydroneopterin triphosphate diphosphatase